MTEHLDNREARDPQRRELDLMGHLPGLLAKAMKSPGWQRHLGDIDTAQINSRAALARLPHPELDVIHREGVALDVAIVDPQSGALLHAPRMNTIPSHVGPPARKRYAPVRHHRRAPGKATRMWIPPR